MPAISWENKYSVKIKKIDKQHKKIISILNDIYDLNQQEKPQEFVGKILQDLIEYIKYHFSTEEGYMIKYEYPDIEEQKREHEKFIDKICEFQKEYLKHRSITIVNLFNFIWDWFAHHILTVDKKLLPFFQQKGVG